MTMVIEELKAQLKAELPALLRKDPSFKDWLLQLVREHAVSKETFDERFDRILGELAADRAAQARNWEEQNRKWEEQNRKWEEQNRKWEDQGRRHDEVLAEIKASRLRYEQQYGAMGSRWGIASEESFRSALKGILEQSFGVQVLNINDFDEEGIVFGVPDQVELDIIIRNGEVIACELKSSMSKSDVYTFDRKAKFYSSRHAAAVTRRIIISPMVRPAAKATAEALGIEVYTYTEDTIGL